MMSRSRYKFSGVGLALALAAAAVTAPTGALGAQQAAAGGVRPTAAAPNTAAAGRPASYNAAYAAAVVDSAIDQLEDFLERYPNSPLRPNALFQLGELLVRRADEEFAQAQRAAGGTSSAAASGDTAARGGDAPIRANYGPAIVRYEELVRRYPNFQKIDAAAYTLGTLYVQNQRWDDAVRMFDLVVAADSS